MPTNKQRELVKTKITSKHSTDADIMRSTGYSETTVRQSPRTMESKGVQELLAEATQGSEWLSPQGMRKCIEKAVKAEYSKSRADTILRFYGLQVQSQLKNIDARSVTNISISSKDIEAEAIEYVNAGLHKQELKVSEGKVVKRDSTRQL